MNMNTVMCKGFIEDCAPARIEMIFGKDLYPGGDVCDWYALCDWNCWPRPYQECYKYDLSALLLNEHEVAVAFADLSGLATNARYHVLIKWYDTEGNNPYTYRSNDFTNTDRYRTWSWFGYCNWEITKNGMHKVILELYEDDGLVFSSSHDFEILGIPDPCEGVVCDDICIGDDLWSQKCVSEGADAGKCVFDQLLEENSPDCGYVPPADAKGEISSIDVPASAEEGDSIDLCATITNTGKGPGMFFLRFYDGTTMVRETLPGLVDPGETITDICELFEMPDHVWSGKIELMREE